jgi:hypothetical protein
MFHPPEEEEGKKGLQGKETVGFVPLGQHPLLPLPLFRKRSILD